jgi:hypothetical protein
MPTLLRKNNVTAPLQFPAERRNGFGRSSERPASKLLTRDRRGRIAANVAKLLFSARCISTKCCRETH